MRYIRNKFFIFMLTLVFLLTFCSTSMAATVIDSIFPDVSPNDSNTLFINYLTHRDLLKGFPDGTFRPAAGLTRAEAATLLARVAGLAPVEAPARFSDVKPDHWAAGVIEAAAAAGLLHGYPDGTFRPNNVLSRAEGIALFMRLSKQLDPGVLLPSLEDLASDHWAARPAAIAIAAGMVGLSTDNKQFYPQAPFTRGDLARMLAILLTREPSLYKTNLTGKLAVKKGTATVTRSGKQTIYKPGDVADIIPGDRIKTGAASAAEVVFPDGSGLLLEQKTDLTVKEARGRSYMQPGGTPGMEVDWLALDLKRGKMFGALASRYDITGSEQDKAGLKGNAGVVGPSYYPLVATLGGPVLQEMLVAIANRETETAGSPGWYWDMLPAEKGADGTNVQVVGPDGRPVPRQLLGPDGKPLPWWQVSQTKRVRVQVDMPWGVAGIRGTFWVNTVDESGRSSTALLVGEGEVASGGETVTLTAGQRTEITSATEPPAPAVPLTTQDKKDWVQAKDWALERAQDIQIKQEPVIQPPPPAQPEQPVQPQLPVQQQQPVQNQLPEPVGEQVQSSPLLPDLTSVIDGAIEEAEQDVTTTTTQDSDSSVALGYAQSPPPFTQNHSNAKYFNRIHLRMLFATGRYDH